MHKCIHVHAMRHMLVEICAQNFIYGELCSDELVMQIRALQLPLQDALQKVKVDGKLNT